MWHKRAEAGAGRRRQAQAGAGRRRPRVTNYDFRAGFCMTRFLYDDHTTCAGQGAQPGPSPTQTKPQPDTKQTPARPKPNPNPGPTRPKPDPNQNHFKDFQIETVPK